MVLSTIEVPAAERSEWLDGFSIQHRGWLASLDVLSMDIGAQPVFTNQALIGLSVDHGDARKLLITAGRGAETVTHVIEGPIRVWVERTDEGADAGLAIEAAGGTKAILRFRVAAPTETVDGIA